MAIGRRARPRASRGAAVLLATVLAGAAGVLALWWVRRSSFGVERSDRMAKNADGSRRMIEEVFGAGNYDLADELVAANAMGHDPALPEPTVGPEGVKESARGYRGAFPDLKLTIEQQVAEGDYVATRWSARGTHKAELFGIAATGKESTVTGITIDRWAGGKIAESWTNWDTLGMLQQLGVVPQLGAKAA